MKNEVIEKAAALQKTYPYLTVDTAVRIVLAQMADSRAAQMLDILTRIDIDLHDIQLAIESARDMAAIAPGSLTGGLPATNTFPGGSAGAPATPSTNTLHTKGKR